SGSSCPFGCVRYDVSSASALTIYSDTARRYAVAFLPLAVVGVLATGRLPPVRKLESGAVILPMPIPTASIAARPTPQLSHTFLVLRFSPSITCSLRRAWIRSHISSRGGAGTSSSLTVRDKKLSNSCCVIVPILLQTQRAVHEVFLALVTAAPS